MTELNVRRTSTLVAFLLSALLLGCATMQTSWRHAVSLSTWDAYTDFVNKYPKSSYSDSARLRADSLAFDEGLAKGDLEYYNALALWLPDRLVVYSLARRERHYYLRAQQAASPEAFQAFIEQYPEGRYSSEAEARLSQIEDSAWERAAAENSVNSFERFYCQFPAGEHASESKIRLDRCLGSVNSARRDTLETKLAVYELTGELRLTSAWLGIFGKTGRSGELRRAVVALGKWQANWDTPPDERWMRRAANAALKLAEYGPVARDAVPVLLDLFPVCLFYRDDGRINFGDYVSAQDILNNASWMPSAENLTFLSPEFAKMVLDSALGRYLEAEAQSNDAHQESRSDVDNYGRPAGGYTSGWVNRTIAYSLCAGAYALYKITGEDLGPSKAAWENWSKGGTGHPEPSGGGK